MINPKYVVGDVVLVEDKQVVILSVHCKWYDLYSDPSIHYLVKTRNGFALVRESGLCLPS